MTAPLVNLARVEELFNAAELKRNHQHQDGDKYEGEWTIIPTEDFRRLRAAREALDLATVTRLAEVVEALPICVHSMVRDDCNSCLRGVIERGKAAYTAAQEDNARLEEAIRASGRMLLARQDECLRWEEDNARLRAALERETNVWDWLVGQMMDPHSSAYVDWDAFEDFAVKAGLIVETRYDPEQHGPDFESVEPGDPFWILTPKGQRLASAPRPTPPGEER